jgi:hypothetical protein
MKINIEQIEKLQDKIFNLLMSNPDMELGEINDCRDAAKELVEQWIEESKPPIKKAAYELIEKTDFLGDVWYSINKNSQYVGQSSTKNLSEAEEMLEKLISFKSSEPIINVLKTIEIDE